MRLDISYLDFQIEIFHSIKPGENFILIPKGRRLGLTKGAANSFCEWGIEGMGQMLWVDTVNGNIDRYVDRYFKPVLNGLPPTWWKWNQQKKELKICDSIIDFRSADTPETIEGFGYKRMFLNEAGIILKNDYLYSQAILPMLLDYPDSVLIAGGAPKGKFKKDGSVHKFYELCEKARNGEPGYKYLHYTSYDNPLLRKEDIDAMAIAMSQDEFRQEILGEFVDFTGNNPFATQYSDPDHVSAEALFDPGKQLYISIDFNINPFCAIFKHNWQDSKGFHSHQFDEIEIVNGSIPAMIEQIRARYASSLPNCKITGDIGGKKRDLSQADNSSYFRQLQRGLQLRDSQLVLTNNPTHDISRADTNYILFQSLAKNAAFDFKIHPSCKGTIRDLKRVQCDGYGAIIKTNRKDVAQLSDFLDCVRYDINTFWKNWIDKHSKRNRNTK